ncbi:MAG: protein of unknown function DUF755 [Anelloviridae sp.]|nr:MAG: protein of unknown function DUF755 [Anelloviridae sp.]
MKSLIQQQTSQKKFTHGTLEDTFLQNQLKKELQKAQLMTNLCSQMEDKLQRTSRCGKQKHKRKRPRKHKRRHYSSSSSSSSTTTNNSNSDSET